MPIEKIRGLSVIRSSPPSPAGDEPDSNATLQEMFSRWTTVTYTHVDQELDGIKESLRAINSRFDDLEYIHPNIKPAAPQDDDVRLDELRARVVAKLLELRPALSRADEVDAYALLASIRADLKKARDSALDVQERRYALGYLYDAATFTAAEGLGVDQVDSYEAATNLALAPSRMNADILAKIRALLDEANFEFEPVGKDEC